MEYESTSHISSWSFSASEIKAIRRAANNRARRLIIEANEKIKTKEEENEEHESNCDPSIPQSSPQAQLLSTQIPVSFAKGYQIKNGKDIMEDIIETDDLPFLSPEEEVALVHFYATKLFSLIGPNAQHPSLRRDVKVPSTAALLLRRFYLSNSVMIYDPKIFMVACAFLAAKIEDATVDIRYLEEGTNMMKAHVTIPEIIKSEIHLAAGCDYDFLCLHPYRAVESYTEDLRIFLKSKDGQLCVNREWVGSADLRPLYEEAKRIVEEVAMTDAPLLATAGQIGIASLRLANERLIQTNGSQITDDNIENKNEENVTIEIDFKGYLSMRFGSSHKERDIDKIWDNIDGLCKIINGLKDNDQVDMAFLKGIHKKLKKCRGNDDKKKKKKKRKQDE